MTLTRLFLLPLLVASGLSSAEDRAQAASGDDNVARCEALVNTDFSFVQDAPTQVLEARTGAANAVRSAYCEVSGYVAPSVGFVMRLPLREWNGKFMEAGCLGACGHYRHLSLCDEPLRRGYACIVSDAGHKSGNDLKWAFNNPQGEIDFGFRAPHVTALAGKAIVERYYQKAATKSYFAGCSTGGRQALMEAQRFPWDFDGIIAASPSLDVPAIHMSALWAIRALTDEAGRPLFVQADLEVLHKAVVAKCDMNDGIADGLIGDPRVCTFDPAVLLCKPTQNTGCLTAKQVDSVNKMYRGPVTSRGEAITFPGPMKGSELVWLETFMPGSMGSYIADEFRYSGFQPNPGPRWRSADFDFDRDYKRLGVAAGLYAAVNPDLRKLKSSGGKLLAYAGWNDAAGMPLPMVDYYETVQKTMGGSAMTQDFFRLYVLPGMNHCGGGDGASAVDWLSYLEGWVEQGRAPEKISGAHLKPDSSRDDWALEFPLDPKVIEFSRPAYPYPTTVTYSGRGDRDAASSFGRAPARIEAGR